MKYFLFGIRQVFAYISFLMKAQSRHGHGIHSPFVYNFCRKVLLEKAGEIPAVEGVRNSQKHSHETISFTDLGAGSIRKNQTNRKLSEVSKHASDKKRNKFLFNLVKFLQPSQIVELGTSLGYSTMYMAIAAPVTDIYTIEGVPELAKIASDNFQKLGLGNIHVRLGNFDNEFPALMLTYKNNTLTFIDGNHTCEATLRYFDLILQQQVLENVVVIDDIRWSKGMYSAWKKILTHKRVSLSIDLFYLGIVFLDKNMAKQSFRFRL